MAPTGETEKPNGDCRPAEKSDPKHLENRLDDDSARRAVEEETKTREGRNPIQ